MLFGKIDYINSLPLHLYLKKSNLPSYVKKSADYKKNVPAILNKKLNKKLLDCAVISSIESAKKKYKNLNFGICANKKVLSVLVKSNEKNIADKESATSNALAKVLKLDGKVIIGDKALAAYLKEPNLYTDMCQKWYEKTKLPFVFARFSSVKNHKQSKRIFKNFTKNNLHSSQRQKIPNYILENYSKNRNISKENIKIYLKFIYYKINKKELKALNMYIKLTKSSS